MPKEDVLKRFDFGINITKAYQDPNTGKNYIKGIASDTGIDHHGEKFSENALNGMVNCITKSTPASVILLPTHWDTFEIGKAVYADVIPSPTHKDLKALDVTIELNMEYPQSKDLYKEIESGNAQKQMSVGGYLNPDNSNSYFWEENDYEMPDGKLIKDYTLVLNDLVLDHIAVTRKDRAANPRTGFSQAIAKSLGLEKPELPQLNKNKEVEKMSKIEKQSQSLIEMVSNSISNFFKSDNETAKAIEAAKQKAQEAMDILKDVQEDPEAQTLQSQLNVIISHTVTAVNPDDDDEDETDESGEPVEPSDPAKSIDEAPVSEVPASEIPVPEEPLKSVTETPEVPSIDVDALKSNIVEEITKSINDEQHETFKDISKSLGEVIAQTIKSAMAPLHSKIEELERFSGKSKSLAGQESDTPVVKQSSEDEGNLWEGIIKSAIPSYVVAEKLMDKEGGNE